MRTIQYAIDMTSGMVISQVGNKIYHPILDFDGMSPENNWQMDYYYEEMSVHAMYGSYHYYKWTRKIPNKIKNFHRKYWGFKLLKGKNRWEV